MSVRPFSEHGHYTAVHDAVFDVVMPFCPPNAFKVLLFVLRKTRGWKKDEDVLRYSEIKAGTGIKSDATLAKELDWLLRKKLLNARDEGGGPHRRGSRKAPAYSLNRDFELKATTSENEVSTTSENEASNNHPSQETSVEANASSGIAKSEASADSADVEREPIGLEKFVVDGIYAEMDRQGYTLDNSDFGYHLGRAQKMLEKMNPTDVELEELPGGCVADFEIHSKTDAMSGLRYMRQQKARQKRIAEGRNDGPSFYEQNNHDKPKSAIWYASLYESADFETVEGWIKEGLTHSQIEQRLESGAVA